MSVSFIHTPRLILRQWHDTDLEPYVAMNMDPEVMRYFPALQSQKDSIAQVARFQTFIEENGFGFFAVERRDTGAFIGFTGLSRPRFESFFTPCIEIGWRLARAHWGQGFAQEAARACLDMGFDKLNFNEIYSFTSQLNLPSLNVMKKIGMKEVGQFEHPLLPEGHPIKTHRLYKIERLIT